jgi:putative FmdB family regulatory protein
MPHYLYLCPACEISFEEQRPAAMAGAPVECPICAGFCDRRFTPISVARNSIDDAMPAEQAGDPPGAAIAHGPSCPCCAGRVG